MIASPNLTVCNSFDTEGANPPGNCLLVGCDTTQWMRQGISDFRYLLAELWIVVKAVEYAASGLVIFSGDVVFVIWLNGQLGGQAGSTTIWT